MHEPVADRLSWDRIFRKAIAPYRRRHAATRAKLNRTIDRFYRLAKICKRAIANEERIRAERDRLLGDCAALRIERDAFRSLCEKLRSA